MKTLEERIRDYKELHRKEVQLLDEYEDFDTTERRQNEILREVDRINEQMELLDIPVSLLIREV